MRTQTRPAYTQNLNLLNLHVQGPEQPGQNIPFKLGDTEVLLMSLIA